MILSTSLTPTMAKAASPGAAPKAATELATPHDSVSLSGPFDLESKRSATRAEAASLAAKLQDCEFVPGELLVKLANTSERGLSSFASDYGAKVATRFELPGAMAADFNGQLVKLALPENLSEAEALAVMNHDPRVACADLNDRVHLIRPVESNEPPANTPPANTPPANTPPSSDPPPTNPAPPTNPTPPAPQPAPPSDPPPAPPELPEVPNDLNADLWGLHNTGQANGVVGADINILPVWKEHIVGSRTGPIVAILDTGIDGTHPDLVNNLWVNTGETGGDNTDNDNNGVIDDVNGYNAILGNGNVSDDNDKGHGTHCAGTIGAEGNNGAGVVGVNWQARMMAVKFLNAAGGGTLEDAIKGMLYANKMGARIANHSWADNRFNQILFDTMKASPALNICASGNDGFDNDLRPVYPSSFALPNIISVTAHDNQNNLPKFANRGEKSVHLAAPGVEILSCKPGGDVQKMSGTSMATPHVTGVAALIATQFPQATNDQIKLRLLSGVDPLPEQYQHRLITGGRLNAAKSLENDSTPPAQIPDFKASAGSPTQVNLNWTATGDDGAVGKASLYQMRYSELPIVLEQPDPPEVTFQSAQPLAADKPAAAGSAEGLKVDLAPAGHARNLHFALRALDNVGNPSPLAQADVTVPAVPVAFEDTMEGSAAAWTPEGTWARVEEPGHGQVWTDSPNGDYQNNTNFALTSKPMSLKSFTNSKLYFDERHDIEVKHDGLHVEVFGKKGWGGAKWREEVSYDGANDWQSRVVDLSAYDGQDIQVRFRMEADDSRVRDGAYIDNVVVTGDK